MARPRGAIVKVETGRDRRVRSLPGRSMINRTAMWTWLLATASACASGPQPSAPTPADVALLTAEPAANPAPADPVPVPEAAEPSPPMTLASERAIQMEGAVLTHLARRQRLADAALPLLRSGIEMCGSRGNEFGFRYSTLDEYSNPAERQVYETILGIRTQPTVLMVMRGAAAERAGLMPGDVIRAAGTVEIGPGRTGSDAVARILGRWPRDTRLKLWIERDGKPMQLGFVPETVCDYSVWLAGGDEINAWADGDTIGVEMGLMRFATLEHELQAVIAHEMAHNSEGHQQAKARNLVLSGLRGAVRDVAAAAADVRPPGEFSRSQEREADYVGMYYLARAGVDTRGIGLVWRRLAAEKLDDIRSTDPSTHPSILERSLHLDAIHREIARKRDSGQPLLPNRSADGTLILPKSGGKG